MNDTKTLETILFMKTFAVVGLSPNPLRSSHWVSAYLQSQGYTIIPVNPGHDRLLEETCYPTLQDIPGPVDGVVIFRRPEFVPDIVTAAIEMGAKAIWMQDGVIHPAAARCAEDAGLLVIMDDCIYRRHRERVRMGIIKTS